MPFHLPSMPSFSFSFSNPFATKKSHSANSAQKQPPLTTESVPCSPEHEQKKAELKRYQDAINALGMSTRGLENVKDQLKGTRRARQNLLYGVDSHGKTEQPTLFQRKGRQRDALTNRQLDLQERQQDAIKTLKPFMATPTAQAREQALAEMSIKYSGSKQGAEEELERLKLEKKLVLNASDIKEIPDSDKHNKLAWLNDQEKQLQKIQSSASRAKPSALQLRWQKQHATGPDAPPKHNDQDKLDKLTRGNCIRS